MNTEEYRKVSPFAKLEKITALPEIQQNIDLYSNTSLQKYVSEETKVPKEYIPPLLKKIESELIKFNPNEKHQLVLQAKNGLEALSEKFYQTFKAKKHNYYIYINSSYRPRTAQYYLLKEGCSNARCASIWASEHQLGLAVDLAIWKKDKTRWEDKIALKGEHLTRMKKNAYKYGFINTYQKWITIDGKFKEARHRRYVGIKLAKYLHYKKLSFSEFYQLQQK